MRDKPLHICCRWCSGLNTVGIFLTFLFVPEPLRVPLAELDRRYAYSSAGKVYHGASCQRTLFVTVSLSRLLHAGRAKFVSLAAV